MTLAALIMVAAAEWQARRTLSQSQEPPLKRPQDVQFFHRVPSNFPPISDRPKLLLIGNSHTYALPGLQRGDILRDRSMASRPVLIDDISAALGRRDSDSKTTCYALAYPNFLPYEMLTRVAHAYHHGFRPNLVIIGVTWRNVARDSQLRPEIRGIYRDEADFAAAFAKMLAEPGIDADRQVIDAIAIDRRWGTAEIERARLRSHADVIDESVAGWVGDRLTLLGGSAALRARFNQTLAIPIQESLQALLGQTRTAYRYDVVEHDFDLNSKCLWTMMRLLRRNGADIVCYLAPERTDVQPLMDPKREAKFIADFPKQAEKLGAVVLDARRVVPNEFWGWNGNLPDDSHFTEPGHERLAQFLVDEIGKRGILRALDTAQAR